MEHDPFTRNTNQSLAVGQLPSAAELAFAEKIWRQLPRLDQTHIVIVSPPMDSDDAQRHANQLGEPVALVDKSGKVLALRMPQ